MDAMFITLKDKIKRNISREKKQFLKFLIKLPEILRKYPTVYTDIKNFNRTNDNRFKIKFRNLYPIINEKTATTSFDLHYIYHTGWAARKLVEINPAIHYDISSSLYFASIASAFCKMKFYDYRPANLQLNNLDCQTADLTNLHFEDNSIESLSCMHVVEHVGLGRYGDPVDPIADIRAIMELKRVIKPHGCLLFVVPVGRPRIQFNAHRIYSFDMIKKYFDGFELKEFSLISYVQNRLILNCDPLHVKNEDYGCGCFWLIKK